MQYTIDSVRYKVTFINCKELCIYSWQLHGSIFSLQLNGHTIWTPLVLFALLGSLPGTISATFVLTTLVFLVIIGWVAPRLLFVSSELLGEYPVNRCLLGESFADVVIAVFVAGGGVDFVSHIDSISQFVSDVKSSSARFEF